MAATCTPCRNRPAFGVLTERTLRYLYASQIMSLLGTGLATMARGQRAGEDTGFVPGAGALGSPERTPSLTLSWRGLGGCTGPGGKGVGVLGLSEGI